MKCPACEGEGKLKTFNDTFGIKGVLVRVRYRAFQCQKCGDKWLDEYTDDPFQKAYDKIIKVARFLQVRENIRRNKEASNG